MTLVSSPCSATSACVLAPPALLATCSMMIRGRHASDRRPGGRAVSKWRRADVYLDGFYGITRHLFIDVAVPDPCGATSRAAGSATRSGVAAAANKQRNRSAVRRSRVHFVLRKHNMYFGLTPFQIAARGSSLIDQAPFWAYK